MGMKHYSLLCGIAMFAAVFTANATSYTISTVSEWNTFATNYSNYTSEDVFTLTADLDFTGDTAITPFTVFYGELDGNDHTITINHTTAATYSGALFNKVDTDGFIHDFTVAGSFTTGYTYTGCVSGHLFGTARNVVNKAEFTTTARYTGGLFGYIYTTGHAINCGNNGKGTATGTSSSIGGVCGYIKASDISTTISLDSCYNSSDITGYSKVGGIAAEVGTAKTIVTFNACYNTANITASSASAVYAGGLVAYQGKSSDTSSMTFNGCYNTGNVTASSDGSNCLGGIVGYSNAGVYFTDCYNTGNITGSYYVGGLLSYAYSKGNTFTDCFNTGDITGTSTSYGYVGGITGQSNTTTMTNVYNAGNISGLQQVGGIIGDVHTSNVLTATGAYSIGTVTATNGLSGSLFGCSADELASISGNSYTGCYALSTTVPDGAIDTTVVTSKTFAELAALDMGDGWTAGDNYTYPRITTLADNDYAKAYAAAVVPADSTDVYSAMTGAFYLGAPDGVTWTADNSVISYDGQMGYFNADYAGGTITMTATSGDVSVTTELVYGVVTTDVDAAEYTLTPISATNACLDINSVDYDNYPSSLETITLTFDQEVYVNENGSATISNLVGDSQDVTLSQETEGSTEVIVTVGSLSFDGLVYVTVAKGSIGDTTAKENNFEVGVMNDEFKVYTYYEMVYEASGGTVTVSPEEGSVDSLSTITVTFEDCLYAWPIENNTALFTLTDSEGNTVATGSAKDTYQNYFVITLSETITDYGTYTLTLPAGTISVINSYSDYTTRTYVDTLTFTYSIEGTLTTDLEIKSIDPAGALSTDYYNDNYSKISEVSEITLTFDEPVYVNPSVTQLMFTDGINSWYGTPAKSESNDSAVVITLPGTYNTAGCIYTLVLTEATVGNADAYKWDFAYGKVNAGDYIYFVIEEETAYETGTVSIVPEEGVVGSLSQFTLTFEDYADSYVAYNDYSTTTPYVTDADGNTVATGTVGDDTYTNVSTVTLNATVSDAGQYTFVVPANTYYLGGYTWTNSEDLTFSYTIEESVDTGISSISADDDSEMPTYNLAGQRVSATTKGILIRNGKKIVNK